MSNKPLASPEAYPIAWLNAIRDGGGVFYEGDMPWTPQSSRKRFFLLLQLLRKEPNHPLYRQARQRWYTSVTGAGLEVHIQGKPDAELNADLIQRALNFSEYNEGKP